MKTMPYICIVLETQNVYTKHLHIQPKKITIYIINFKKGGQYGSII